MAAKKTLLEAMALERLELNLFRGTTENWPGARIFGGQVIAQALWAAYETVEERLCHSLHAYFIRPGDASIPIIFEVDRARDGGSYTTRRVIAIQNGQQIFNMAASFQAPEEGLEHQLPAPAGPSWRDLPDEATQKAIDLQYAPQRALALLHNDKPVEMRMADSHFEAVPMSPTNQLWMRAKDPIPDDIRLHHVVMAYASDLILMGVAFRPHPIRFHSDGVQGASLDHALWLHRPFNFNNWILQVQDSPITTGGRGLARGTFYDEDGVLFASSAQEGMMRVRKR